jgi:hypothetical protein
VRIQILLGDKGDRLMAFAAPCERAGTTHKTEAKYKNNENCQAGPIQVSTSV